MSLFDPKLLRRLPPVRRALVIVACVPIALYRLTISRLLPQACRFHPSCSVYALGALQRHGPWRGGWLALRRIARCHPFNPGGLDPVPGSENPGISSSPNGPPFDSAAPPARGEDA